MEINFLDDAKHASQEEKTLMIMFVKDGCAPCKEMKQKILSDPNIQAFLKKNYLSYQVNIFGDLPIFDIRGKQWSEKSYSEDQKIWGTPAFYFYDINGHIVYKHMGFLSKNKFLALVQGIHQKF